MIGLEPARLPWGVRRSPDPVSRRQLATLDGLLVVTPRRIPPSALKLLPELTNLRRLIGRLGKAADGRVFRRHLGAAGATLSFSRLPGDGAVLPPAFALLKLAGELVADALTDEPRTVGILVDGLAPADRARVEEALLLALGGPHLATAQRQA